MNLPVIPAPARFEPGGDAFAFRTGATVAFAGAGLAPVVERFCSDFVRRTGLRLEPGDVGARDPGVRIELAPPAELAPPPAPAGPSPVADDPPAERYALTVDAAGIVLRAAAAAGIARG